MNRRWLKKIISRIHLKGLTEHNKFGIIYLYWEKRKNSFWMWKDLYFVNRYQLLCVEATSQKWLREVRDWNINRPIPSNSVLSRYCSRRSSAWSRSSSIAIQTFIGVTDSWLSDNTTTILWSSRRWLYAAFSTEST
jgi:hypothetical protein